jgi:rhodanese-related sulfurtransferase
MARYKLSRNHPQGTVRPPSFAGQIFANTNNRLRRRLFCSLIFFLLKGDAVSLFTSISVRDAKDRLVQGWTPFILDVRMAHESEIAELPGTDQICDHDLVFRIADELPKDRDILVYCKSGQRSLRACDSLAKLGHTRLFNLEGGTNAWSREIDPTIQQY